VYVPHADATAHTDADADVYMSPHAATYADPDVYVPHADATAVEPTAAAERQPHPVADDAAFRGLVAVAAHTPGVGQRQRQR
jgi:hypothetical protein